MSQKNVIIVWEEYLVDESAVRLISVSPEHLDAVVSLVDLDTNGTTLLVATESRDVANTMSVEEWVTPSRAASLCVTNYLAEGNMEKMSRLPAHLRELLAERLATVDYMHHLHESWRPKVEAAIAKLRRRCPKCDGTGSAYTDSRGNYWPCPNGCKP